MKRSEIIPAVLAALAAAQPAVTTVYDDFSKTASTQMEAALLNNGLCYVVKPLLGSRRTAQSGARVTEQVDFSVHVRVNPAAVPAGFNTYDAQDAISFALCSIAGVKASEDATTLVVEDVGCLTHALLFQVLVTNQ